MDSQFLFNITFSCGDELRDFRDGKAYATVQIGTQCWMAENMNVGTRIDESEDQTDNNTIEKYCYTIGPLSFCDDYGGLYQWDEMMQYVTTEGAQGICPEGWHLPSDAEWKTMEMYLGMPQEDANRIGCRGTDEGGKLKETGTSHWLSPNTGASNSSGFTAVGGGFSDKGTPAFYNLNAYGYFWSSSKIGSYAWHRHLFYDDAMINRFKYILTMGYSVRCVRD
jgi:uncharacterized protein (TIGR02145 family)